MSILKPKDDVQDVPGAVSDLVGSLDVRMPDDEQALIPLPEAREELKTDWKDPTHEYLQVEILDVDGSVLASTEFPAPVNTNAEHPCWIRMSIGHSDGCYRVLSRTAIATY